MNGLVIIELTNRQLLAARRAQMDAGHRHIKAMLIEQIQDPRAKAHSPNFERS